MGYGSLYKFRTFYLVVGGDVMVGSEYFNIENIIYFGYTNN